MKNFMKFVAWLFWGILGRIFGSTSRIQLEKKKKTWEELAFSVTNLVKISISLSQVKQQLLKDPIHSKRKSSKAGHWFVQNKLENVSLLRSTLGGILVEIDSVRGPSADGFSCPKSRQILFLMYIQILSQLRKKRTCSFYFSLWTCWWERRRQWRELIGSGWWEESKIREERRCQIRSDLRFLERRIQRDGCNPTECGRSNLDHRINGLL